MDITEQVRASAGAGYQVILADAAWRFKANRKASNFEELEDARAMNSRVVPYPTMTLKELEAMPVKGMIADQAICFFWITGPFLAIGAHIPILKAWGFKPKAMGFTWAKTRKNVSGPEINVDKDMHFGAGLTTRKNGEFCILASRGKSMRKNNSVRELGIYPVMEHSRKPVEFRQRIEQYVGPGLKMAELFSRQSGPGWDCFGNEVGKFNGV